ncbi:MAG TPA: hypothetical protein EYQ83_13330 [Acidobacteria bacterium]|nr:hypothetical protein [Acidobacteriota bacterium]
MSNRPFAASSFLLVVVVLTPVETLAQSAAPPAGSGPRTAWGAPDLQGIWDFRTITPLERPDELAGKEVLTAEEAAEYEQRSLNRQNKDLRAEDGISAQRDVANAYNQFWWDYGDRLTEDRRTSLVVDPPDGKIPRNPEALSRFAALAGAMGGTPAGPEDRPLWERCILGFNSGPPMLPSAYNNNVQLLQTPDTVVIFNEMVHNARIVPLASQPRLPDDLRLVTGDARGHWEGATLVVETTNFLRETGFTGAGAGLQLTERFTRADGDTLLYEFTVDDPEAFSAPWTAVIPMTRSDSPMFEYACHEGNYGMTNLLAGARAEDAGR